MSIKRALYIFKSAVLAALLLITAYLGAWYIAVVAVLVVAALRWWNRGHTRSALLGVSPYVTPAIAAAIIIGLPRTAVTGSGADFVFPFSVQLAVAVLYGLWIVWLDVPSYSRRKLVTIAYTHQLLIVTCIILMGTFIKLPAWILLLAVWLGSYVTMRWLFRELGEKSATILSACWALLVAQITFISQIWTVYYVLFGGIILISQATLIILAVGYLCGMLYNLHSQGKLSKTHLLESVVVVVALVMIILAGTQTVGIS